MKYKTLNKILFGFCITIPLNDRKKGKYLYDERKPSGQDFSVGDYVRFIDDDSIDGEIMTVVGFLKPYLVQVVQAGIDFAEDYELYDVYPEDIEIVSINKIYKKCLLHYV